MSAPTPLTARQQTQAAQDRRDQVLREKIAALKVARSSR